MKSYRDTVSIALFATLLVLAMGDATSPEVAADVHVESPTPPELVDSAAPGTFETYDLMQRKGKEILEKRFASDANLKTRMQESMKNPKVKEAMELVRGWCGVG